MDIELSCRGSFGNRGIDGGQGEVVRVPFADGRGRAGAWFRGTQERHEGRISAGSLQKDVSFADADHQRDDEIDAAYRTKYRRYTGRVLNSVLTPEARSTTTKLMPRSASG